MDKWNLIVNVAECENCSNCVLAAKDELVDNEFPGYSAPHPAHGQAVIRIERTVRGDGPRIDAAYLPRLCNHCDVAPCVKAGSDGAVRKREDGIVIFDPVKAYGRRDLVECCPYGAVVWNEERQLPQTWFFDAHLLDQGWAAPRCVGVCPTGAIEAVKVADDVMVRRARDEGLRVLHPELGTQPRVYYRNLHRIDRCFIAGSVYSIAADVTDCVEGARVDLLQMGQPVAQTLTNAFGDFKFDALAPGSGAYEVRAHHPHHGTAVRSITVGDQSIDLGDVKLEGPINPLD